MEKKRDMAWKVLNRKIVFQDTWVQLEASSCELPDGRIIEPFYIHRDPNFAVVVAVTKDQRLVLVRQYRDAVRPGGWLVLEIGYAQAEAVLALGKAAGWQGGTCRKDAGGNDRVVFFRKPLENPV